MKKKNSRWNDMMHFKLKKKIKFSYVRDAPTSSRDWFKLTTWSLPIKVFTFFFFSFSSVTKLCQVSKKNLLQKLQNLNQTTKVPVTQSGHQLWPSGPALPVNKAKIVLSPCSSAAFLNSSYPSTFTCNAIVMSVVKCNSSVSRGSKKQETARIEDLTWKTSVVAQVVYSLF